MKNSNTMEAIQVKSTGGNFSSSNNSKVKKQKTVKVKKSVLQLSKELIPDGKYAGLSSILEPYELGLGK
jgi:hypothetical protein